MKNNDRRIKGLEAQLTKKMARGDRFAIRTLDEEQLDYVQNVLKLTVTPELFEITAMALAPEQARIPLLRDVRRAWNSGMGKLVRKLSGRDQNILSSNGIMFRVLKYRIILA